MQDATGSFAAAGVAGGAFSLGVAVAAPLRGRLIDRRGSRAALPAMALISATALAALAVLAGTAPDFVLVLLAGVAGAATPPLVASMRLEWQRLLPADQLPAAYALESALQTAVFVVGPLIAAAGIALAGSRATLAATSAVLLAGSVAFAALARTPPEPAVPGAVSPIRRPGVVTLVLVVALADVGLGGVDVIVAAFADERGSPELAGVLLAVLAAGSVAGALAYGLRAWPAVAGLVVTGIAGAATVAVLALPDAALPLALLLFVAGTPPAAHWTASSVALDHATGGRGGAEAYTWLSAANSVGIGIGTVVGGAAVEAWGTSTAFLLVAAGPLLAAVVVAVRRATLEVPARGALH